MKHQHPGSKPSATFEGLENLILLGILVALLAFLPSCKSTPQTTTPPAGCGQSILYRNIQAAKIADAALVIGLTAAATQYPEVKPYAETAVETLSAMLDDNQVTYVEFLEAVVANVKWLNTYCGTALLALSPLLSSFDQPVPIDACDVRLLKEHLAREKAALAKVGG